MLIELYSFFLGSRANLKLIVALVIAGCRTAYS